MRLGKALGSSRDPGGPRWVSGCCVVLPGAAPGRLEPEPGRAEREPGRRARSCSRRCCRAPECHLRDTRQPLGSGRRAPPHPASWARNTEGESPARPAVGTNTAPGARRGVWGAHQSPPHPSRYPAARQLPITSRPSLSGCDAHPSNPGPALSGLRIRCRGGQVEGGGGGGDGSGL